MLARLLGRVMRAPHLCLAAAGLQMEGLVLEAAEDWVQVYVPKYGIEKRARLTLPLPFARVARGGLQTPFSFHSRGRPVVCRSAGVYFNDDARVQGTRFDSHTKTATVDWEEQLPDGQVKGGAQKLVPLERCVVVLSARGTPMDYVGKLALVEGLPRDAEFFKEHWRKN